MPDNLISPLSCSVLLLPPPPCTHLAVSSSSFSPGRRPLSLSKQTLSISCSISRPSQARIMRVNCDVCGGEPAAVLCCADEAALCSACDRRVHRANKLAGKHRRIPLVHPAGGASSDDGSSTTTGPLCDVCKERRGLVFCVEDRAILCPDCDDPIHSANDLTAKHTRFLLVGAKLSNEIVDPQEPDCNGGGDSDGVPVACAQDASTDRSSSVLECSDDSNGGGGAMISDYLTNICPGWRVDDLLFDESPFSSAATKPAREEHVPSMDADLFDVVARQSEKRSAWGPPSWTTTNELCFEEVPSTTMAAPTAPRPAKQGRVRETYWDMDNDSDVFAVPEITPPPAKKARAPSYWCF